MGRQAEATASILLFRVVITPVMGSHRHSYDQKLQIRPEKFQMVSDSLSLH